MELLGALGLGWQDFDFFFLQLNFENTAGPAAGQPLGPGQGWSGPTDNFFQWKALFSSEDFFVFFVDNVEARAGAFTLL